MPPSKQRFDGTSSANPREITAIPAPAMNTAECDTIQSSPNSTGITTAAILEIN